MMRRTISLYIHIPFCVKKCAYCDFLSFPAADTLRQQYVEALCAEIRALGKRYGAGTRVPTIFFGGGTPSLLLVSQLQTLMDTVQKSFCVDASAEISMECNPGTVCADSLAGYRRAGINRLSLGLQSVHDAELRRLGRIHTWRQFEESWHWAREAGFTNLNVDLMSGLPGQTLSSWKESLQKVMILHPEHISAYSLIIEEGTPFYERYADEAEVLAREGCHRADFVPYEQAALPEEEEERAMYEQTQTILQAVGYHRYEISNYALAGRECRHNKRYWTLDNYLGAGIGAASYVNGERWSNVRNLKSYLHIWTDMDGEQACEQCQVERTKNTRDEQMEEMMFLGLRLMEGVSDTKFQRYFGCTLRQEYGAVIARFEKMGLLQWKGDCLALTQQGISVSNQVMAEFMR